MPIARRALLAALAAVLPLRVAASATRSIYDLAVRGNVYGWVGVACDSPTVRRERSVAVVEAACRTTKNKLPRKGAVASYQAWVRYAYVDDEYGDPIGYCEQRLKLKKPGPFVMSCSVPIPEEPALPIRLSGSGSGLSAPFMMPGGPLLWEITASHAGEFSGDLAMITPTSGGFTIWYSYEPSPTTKVFSAGQLTEARILSGIDGPWSIVISDPFP